MAGIDLMLLGIAVIAVMTARRLGMAAAAATAKVGTASEQAAHA